MISFIASYLMAGAYVAGLICGTTPGLSLGVMLSVTLFTMLCWPVLVGISLWKKLK